MALTMSASAVIGLNSSRLIGGGGSLIGEIVNNRVRTSAIRRAQADRRTLKSRIYITRMRANSILIEDRALPNFLSHLRR